MPAPAAAPPAAPAPASTPPPAAAPRPSAAPPASDAPPEKDPKDWMGEYATEIDSLDDDVPPPAKPKAQAEPPPDEDDPPEVEDPNAQEPEQEIQPPEGAQPKPAAAAEPKGIKQLREAYHTQKDRIAKELEPELTRLRTRVKELESSSPAENPATKERLTALEKRNQELESEIRFVNYRKSSEFTDKYQKPYTDAWNAALADMGELEVELPDGTTRRASEQDLIDIANMSLGTAHKEANARFGDSAPYIMHHVQRIRDLAKAQANALDQARKDSEVKAQQAESQTKEQQALRHKRWNEINSDLATRWPRWFAPAEGDTEGNALLQKGFALADLLFRGGNLSESEINMLPAGIRADMEKNKGRLSEEGAIRYHALLRNKVANHDRLARRLNQVSKELAEAKKTLEEYENTAPQTGGRRRAPARQRTPGDYLDDANAEIDAMDR